MSTLLAHLGHIKERDWTTRTLSAALKPLEKQVEELRRRSARGWGELPDKWMKGTALMVHDCRGELRAKKLKKAIKTYELIYDRFERKDKQLLQKKRAAARKGGQQRSEEAQAKKAKGVKYLESGKKLSSGQIGNMVGLSGSRVRGIKREWLAEKSPKK